MGALATLAIPAAILTTPVVLRQPRSFARLLPVVTAVAAGLVLALAAGSQRPDLQAIAVAGAIGFAACNFWYSRFGRAPSAVLLPGERLP